MSIPSSTLPRLGIDVSKDKFDACLCVPCGTPLHKVFHNTPEGFARLQAWLCQHHVPQTLAGLEATGPYGLLLLHHLHHCGHQVCLLNPRHLKDFSRSQGRRVKTDSIDAQLIAAFLQLDQRLQLWQPPPQELAILQGLVRRRHQLMEALQAERRRLQAPGLVEAVRHSLADEVQHLRNAVARITHDIELHLLSCPTVQKSVRLLRSIPGVGLMVAVTILAEVPALQRFKRARHLAAFAGLTPALAQSGSSLRRHGGMTHEGSALLRQMLYMAALQTAMRPASALHGVYKNFLQRGKAKMCALGAIMHKILRIAYGVLKHQTLFTPSLAKL